MAVPTILVNSATGSDSAASGAGPSTAITGSNGRTRNTASQTRVGFFEGTAPDLSGVATDGSHALYLAISTAGQRNFSSINATKNTDQTDVGNMTATSAVVSSIVSTSGWTAGDVIRVAGAGAAGADLYSTILTVDSATQVTLNDAASTTVVAAVVVNPRQVGLTSGEGLNTGATNTAWAIGGVRASIINNANSRRLLENNSAAGDAMPGWIIQLADGHSETHSAAVTFRRSGNTTAGPITLQGAPGAATLPLLTFSNNGDAFVVNNGVNILLFQDFEMRNSNATKTASVAFDGFGGQFSIRRVKIAHSTNKFWKGVSTTGTIEIDGVEIGYCASIGITSNVSFPGFELWNAYVHHCGSHGLSIVQGFGTIDASIFAYNSGDGVNASSGNAFHVVTRSTFYGNTGDGWESTTTASNLARGLWRDNLFALNGGYGLRFSGAGVTAQQLDVYRVRFQGNLFYSNTSGKYNISGMSSEGESTADPGLADPTNHNYAPGVGAAGASFPPGSGAERQPVGRTSSTYNYGAPGAAQRNDWATPSLVLGI